MSLLHYFGLNWRSHDHIKTCNGTFTVSRKSQALSWPPQLWKHSKKPIKALSHHVLPLYTSTDMYQSLGMYTTPGCPLAEQLLYTGGRYRLHHTSDN